MPVPFDVGGARGWFDVGEGPRRFDESERPGGSTGPRSRSRFPARDAALGVGTREQLRGTRPAAPGVELSSLTATPGTFVREHVLRGDGIGTKNTGSAGK